MRRASSDAAVIDAQTVKTTEVACPQRGYNTAKKVYGRKRHIVFDTRGLPSAVAVYSAGGQDQDGAKAVFAQLRERHPKLKVVFDDSAYGRNGLPRWVGRCSQMLLQTVLRPVGFQGFTVLPKR